MELTGSRHFLLHYETARSSASCLYVGATTRIAACTARAGPWSCHVDIVLDLFPPMQLIHRSQNNPVNTITQVYHRYPADHSARCTPLIIAQSLLILATALITNATGLRARILPPTLLPRRLSILSPKTFPACSFATAASTHFHPTQAPPRNTHALYPTTIS